ncbi:MAG: pilin [Patescibacteria group bacterium]
MKQKIFKKTAKIFLLFMFYLKYSVVFAAENYTLLEKLPQMEGEGAPNLGQYLSGIFKLGIGVASVLAVLIIVRGGVKYMTAEATPNTIEDAKQDITNALFGLVLVLSSWILLNTINPDLVNTNLNLKDVVPAIIKKDLNVTTTKETLEQAKTSAWIGKCTCESGQSDILYTPLISTIFGGSQEACTQQCTDKGANNSSGAVYYRCYISKNCSEQ